MSRPTYLVVLGTAKNLGTGAENSNCNDYVETLGSFLVMYINRVTEDLSENDVL